MPRYRFKLADRRDAALNEVDQPHRYPSIVAKQHGVTAHTMRVWRETQERQSHCETLRCFLEEE